ncbi:MAG TPA: cytosine permease, partial [Candidatus Dormibacteraeota bacterium]|nr:cytosine permease [Candidatus Dormibacteraeota bacterium]
MQAIEEVEKHVPIREGDYGEKVATVEPGGVEFISHTERHGKPIQLFWTWLSPNLEFATVFVGVLGIAVFGLSFWETAVAIIVGTALGSATHFVLSSWGPKFGVPMMVESRGAFGFLGNILPAGLNAFTGSIGWFIVNSVSGAFALQALGSLASLSLPFWLTFLIIVVAQVLIATFGHNFIHVFERWALPLLGIVFAAACISIFFFAKANYGVAANPGPIGHFGAFMLLFTAVFGYAAGWNPYAADYTRYMPPTVDRNQVGMWAALGVFVSCVVLELAGAAVAAVPGTKWGPNDIPTVQLRQAMPDFLYYLTLLCIAVGAVAANAINIYSGTLSLVAVGIREMGMTLRQRRAVLAVGAGVLGYVIGIIGQANVGPGSKYESFLLLISYWIGCWLAVVFVDYWIRKGDYGDESIFFDTKYNRWQGFAAMAIGLIVSVGLFGNVYGVYVGPIPNNNGSIGDITFIVG